MTSQIVLISGKQGSGKTTLSDNLRALIFNKPQWHAVPLTFAGPLYEMHDFCRHVLIRAGIDPVHKIKDGNLLQILGTEWGRKTIDENIWVNVLKGRIKNNLESRKEGTMSKDHVVFLISDCRFENELEAFPAALRVRLVCDEGTRKARAEMWRENTAHLSEINLDAAANLGAFDLYLNTEAVSPTGCAELVMAQLEKNVWLEKRPRLDAHRAVET